MPRLQSPNTHNQQVDERTLELYGITRCSNIMILRDLHSCSPPKSVVRGSIASEWKRAIRDSSSLMFFIAIPYGVSDRAK